MLKPSFIIIISLGFKLFAGSFSFFLPLLAKFILFASILSAVSVNFLAKSTSMPQNFFLFYFFSTLPELFEIITYYIVGLTVWLFIGLRASLAHMYILDNIETSLLQALKASFKVTKGSAVLLFSVLVLVEVKESLLNLTASRTWLLTEFSINGFLHEFDIIHDRSINGTHSLERYWTTIFIIIQYYLKTLLTCSFCSGIYLHYRQKLIKNSQLIPAALS